jgi:hypothetical protein
MDFWDSKNQQIFRIPRDLPSFIHPITAEHNYHLSLLLRTTQSLHLYYSTNLSQLKKLKSRKQMLRELKGYIKKHKLN